MQVARVGGVLGLVRGDVVEQVVVAQDVVDVGLRYPGLQMGKVVPGLQVIIEEVPGK